MEERQKRAVLAVAQFLKTIGAEQASTDFSTWRIPLTVGRESHTVLLKLPRDFPFVRPLVLAGGTEEEAQRYHLVIPHANWDGTLCVLPNETTVDPDDPVGVTRATLEAAATLLSEWKSGLRQEDFHDEINAFWTQSSLGRFEVDLPPNFPRGRLHFWRSENGDVYLSSDEERLARIAGLVSLSAVKPPFGEGLFLRLKGLVLPQDYPNDGSSLRRLIRSREGNYPEVLSMLRAKKPFPLVLGLEPRPRVGQEGPIYVGVFVVPQERKTGHSEYFKSKPVGGFRSGQFPLELMERSLLRHEVVRYAAERIDSQWMHFRGGSGKLSGGLFLKNVCVVGCGALGSGLTALLLREGVKHITIVDDDKLRWDNIGRHHLGGVHVNQNKAVAMAGWARAQFFDAEVSSRDKRWQQVLSQEPGFFNQFDLIISATGEWASNAQLNLAMFGKRPVQYIWTEPFAVAGHSLITTGLGGCLGCGFDRTGIFRKRVFDWPKGSNIKLAGCGGAFQPYGLSEAVSICAMSARQTLDFLSGKQRSAELRTWINAAAAPAEAVPEAAWKDKITRLPAGIGEFRELWPHEEGCGICP